MLNRDSARPPIRKWMIEGTLVGVVVLIAVYVLSVGPAYRLYVDGYLNYEQIQIAYWPLYQMGDASEAFETIFRSYIQLWAQERPILKSEIPVVGFVIR